MYEELVAKLRYCNSTATCRDCPYMHGACDDMKKEAADAIEKLSKDLERSKEWEAFWEKEALRMFRCKAIVDEKTALAMMAGAHAIRRNAKRYEGTTYVWDVFGKLTGPKEISYFEAEEHLTSIAAPVLDQEKPKEET